MFIILATKSALMENKLNFIKKSSNRGIIEVVIYRLLILCTRLDLVALVKSWLFCLVCKQKEIGESRNDFP